MGITVLGVIVLPLGIYLFARGKQPLAWATVWAIPFFDTIAFQLPFAPVRPFQYFGALLIARYVLEACIRSAPVTARRSATPLAAVVLVFVFFFSLFAPTLITAPIEVAPEGYASLAIAYENLTELNFQPSNLTQLAYPLFGIALVFALSAHIRSKEDLKRVYRILFTACMLLIGYMVLYQFCSVIGLSTPIELFQWVLTGKAESSFSSYNALGGLARAHTPAGEPGYTGLYYVLVTGLLAGLAYSGYKDAWMPEQSRFFLLILVVALILNASTTGYFGLFVLVATLPFLMVLRRNAHLHVDSGVKIVFKATVVGGVVLIGAVVVAQIALGFSLAEYVLQSHAAKVTDQAGSGAFRFYSLVYSLEEVFMKSPLIGVGYGSHRSLTLISYLLSNVGIIGTVAFLWFNAVIFFHAVKVMNRTEDSTLASFAFALAWTHVALLGTMFVGKSVVSFVFGWLWLVLAMSEGCYRIHRFRMRRAAHALS
jgi:hypothetical protein